MELKEIEGDGEEGKGRRTLPVVQLSTDILLVLQNFKFFFCNLQGSLWSVNLSWKMLGALTEKAALRELRAWLTVMVSREEPRRQKIAKRESGNRIGLVSAP